MKFTLTTEACPHAWDETVMTAPRFQTTVHRDECAYCCRTCAFPDGTYVCMGCHAGFCQDHLSKHLSQKPTHAMYTRVKELPPVEEAEEDKVRDVNYLGVVKPKEYETAVCCAQCQVEFTEVPELAVEAYSGIVNSPVPGAQAAANDVVGYVQKPQCPHLVCVQQLPSPYTAGPPTSDDVCSVEGCKCSVNNWMCVTCGAIGCPRAEAGGAGHALAHFKATGHPAVVKLGTVTAQGADYYCYDCDDDVEDICFAQHMLHFGIDVKTSKKTAKTMGELEYDYASQFDFNKITEAGVDLTPVYGPGHTGIVNIGNSCYISSVVQCLFALSPFQHAFYNGSGPRHWTSCTADPYKCRLCQTERVAAGLWSGEFSCADITATNGISPRLFKTVYAQQHVDFSSGAQQDAQEYLLYLIEEMRRHARVESASPHPANIFEMILEQRTACSKCQRVRYSYEKENCLSLPIPLDPLASPVATGEKLTEEEMDAKRPRCSLIDCLDAAIRSSDVECRCQACGEMAVHTNAIRLATFPDVLPIFLRRAYFDVASLSTKKMDAYVDVPDTVQLEAYRGQGQQPGEVLMPLTTSSAPKKKVEASATVDEVALVCLMSMGIERDAACHALLQTDMNVERAVDFYFNNPDAFAKENVEVTEPTTGGATEATSIPSVATNGVPTYRLVSMISHMGASAKTGHYVCHLRDSASGKWILFNDDKVGVSQHPPFSMASIYFFKRCT